MRCPPLTGVVTATVLCALPIACSQTDEGPPDSGRLHIPGRVIIPDAGVLDAQTSSSCAIPSAAATGAITYRTVTSTTEMQAMLGAGCVRKVDFDDVDTSAGMVEIRADRYASSHGVVITAAVAGGGQYVDRAFAAAANYPPSSPPNMYAPGPIVTVRGPDLGGHRTRVTFTSGGVPAAVAGFGAVFIDADAPQDDPSYIDVFDENDSNVGRMQVSGRDRSQIFMGFVAVDAMNQPVRGIRSVELTNGGAWAALHHVTDVVTLDDFVFGEPGP